MTDSYYPLNALREGTWFKLICGASYQHLPAVRNLVLAYTLAGVDCIDIAADPAVIAVAKQGLQAALSMNKVARAKGFGFEQLPWLMVSLNDGEDPHFRKAQFPATACPPDCSRPCEQLCPAQAIVFHTGAVQATLRGESKQETTRVSFSGVLDDRCYGCGRCLPVCPVQHISTRAYISTPAAVAALVLQTEIDALEIHTQIGRAKDFERLWQAIAPEVHRLKLLAISCPDGEGLIDYLRTLLDLISPLPCALVWQTDGRPMSGDIGVGATRAAVRLGEKVLAAGLPGYVQLAGGTNHHTVTKLKAAGLLNPQFFGKAKDQQQPARSSYIAGIAYGSYARVLLSQVLDQLEQAAQDSTLKAYSRTERSPAYWNAPLGSQEPIAVGGTRLDRLETAPELLWQAVDLANSLVSQLKSPMKQSSALT